MSPIAIGLDGLLILLLLLTFALGLKLERRLKGLRADHAGFAKAVAELNDALARAETGLAELRSAGAQAQAALTSRISEARNAAVRLDELTAKAALTPPPVQTAVAAQPALRDIRPLDLEPAPLARPAAEAAPPVPAQAARDGRSRARVDEDLFEAAHEAFPKLRFAAGGRA
jgi:hypothetical protein